MKSNEYINAMKNVKRSKLCILGMGPLQEELKNRVKDLALENVEFLGFKTVPINSITLIFNIRRGSLDLSTAPTSSILLIFKTYRGVSLIFSAAKISYST